MQQLRSRGTQLLSSFIAPRFKKKAINSWGAVQDTFLSTKDIFERHKVVFTIGTSIATVATTWLGYSLRHHHYSKVDKRLQSIETAMKNNYHLEHAEFKKLIDPGNSHVSAYFATAGTTFIIGYGFGWRGGKWYANRKFRKEQLKLLGLIKPKRWPLLGHIKARGLQIQSLRRRLTRSGASENAVKPSDIMVNNTNCRTPLGSNTNTALNPGEVHPSC